ncbi:alkylation response protein AidB-like acyl-CoA dehydrogenase [Mycobacterium sp. OAS707]|uniref:acyl-CoA dehydrogenase family protein n=1 Tax=Mycobacterium sp. OAS707 TaxID=2663822 RepID=UPI00178B6AC1|nr:acyl-CoA dehydrogenase family protein [Mycobacterium sp. OAS707]MBE1551927.1 alkylation response protein AidB-like acyl-CoA dehydrogenase [Mycobacterium sp. OAS707]
MATGTAETGSGISIHREFQNALIPETLSALMRSTWTWDDRALRRDLSSLLVAVAAARGEIPDEAIATVLHARSLAAGARFTADVLGPHLIADSGSALRAEFLAAASDPASFDRIASQAHHQVRSRATDYLGAISRSTYPDESNWLMMATSETAGLSAAMRGYGKALSEAPLFSNVGLAWQSLRALGGEGTALRERIEKGELRATFAAAERSGSWDPALVRTKAWPDGDDWRLSGTKLFVPDAAGADVILVIARSIAGPSLYAVDSEAVGLTIIEMDSIDATRALFRVDFDDTPTRLLGKEGHGGALMRETIDLAMVALAGEQVGLIERAVAVLLDHTDVEAPTDLTRTVLDHATAVSLWTQALSADAEVGSAAVAHIGCSTASLRVATLAAEIARESKEASAILRRALSASLLLGGPAVFHERLLDRLGI